MPKSKIAKSTNGFTLIELLVVIVIISILSALLMFNFVGVRQRGRDAQRKSDLRQIQVALELYRSDNGTYPLTAGFPTCGSAFTSGSVTYMQKVPCEPRGSGYYNDGNYYYNSSGSTYTIAACLENTNDSDNNNSTSNPGGTAGSCTAITGAKYFILLNP